MINGSRNHVYYSESAIAFASCFVAVYLIVPAGIANDPTAKMIYKLFYHPIVPAPEGELLRAGEKFGAQVLDASH